MPKGQRYSGQYDANIYSVSATVVPISRLYLTGLFSLQDTHTLSEIATYKGNVYTVLGAAGYADFDPASSNDTPDGQKGNRRIEIVVEPNLSELPSLDGLGGKPGK